MFVGHFAVALGAKRYSPVVSLGTLFLACQLADLLWPSLVLFGVEHFEIAPGNTVLTPLRFTDYPWSHSLLALTAWAALFALLYASLRRGPRRAAVILAIVVLSHWLLDVLTHTQDMPLAPGVSSRVGLGLWNYPLLSISLELAMFVLGTWMYARATRARNRKGAFGLWGLVVFLLLIYAANMLGPPPPSKAAVTWSAQAMWLLVAYAYWLDRQRVAR